ncbi:cell adhesion molecule 4-like [Anneissia japonica]|uniref:cell adhesion molecule 4-like n=1 Tax=Anneissia japonica TaxID=1529436 RepID=UPI0014256CF7|nr:cell adhesion molecule 4-like [Anneissia japonica]
MAEILCTAYFVTMCNIIMLLVFVVNWKQAIGQQFLPDMKDVSVLEGESVTVKCFLEGDLSEGISISWWKSDRQISAENGIVIKDPRLTANLAEIPDTNKIMYWLVISSSVRQDEGNYYCRISHPYEKQSEFAHVTILQKPSSEYPQCLKSRKSYIAGSDVKLTCISEVVLPPVELRWSRRPTSLTIPPMHVSKEMRDNIAYKHLQFTARKEDNEQTFVCEQHTEVMSDTLNCTISDLNIQYNPEVKIRHTNAIYAGSNSILFCQSVANPPVATFRWTFQPMLEPYEYETEGQVLRLLKLAVTRNGTHVTCTATNRVGSGVDSF